MPQGHLINLGYLMRFLKLAAEKSDENKMNARNLSMVIAPSMFGPNDAMQSFDGRIFDLIEFMIINANTLVPGGKIK